MAWQVIRVYSGFFTVKKATRESTLEIDSNFNKRW